MKRIIGKVILLVSLSLVVSGCATPYMKNRMRDAADIFTCAYGAGGGAKLRVGPLNTGMLLQWGQGGLKGGEWQAGSLHSAELLTTVIPFPPKDKRLPAWVLGVEHFTPCNMTTYRRGKGYLATSRFPFITTGLEPTSLVDLSGKVQNVSPGPYPFSYWTQVETFLGLGMGLRLGFNPGELLDFILGWTTLDIYGDDIEEDP